MDNVIRLILVMSWNLGYSTEGQKHWDTRPNQEGGGGDPFLWIIKGTFTFFKKN